MKYLLHYEEYGGLDLPINITKKAIVTYYVKGMKVPLAEAERKADKFPDVDDEEAVYSHFKKEYRAKARRLIERAVYLIVYIEPVRNVRKVKLIEFKGTFLEARAKYEAVCIDHARVSLYKTPKNDYSMTNSFPKLKKGNEIPIEPILSAKIALHCRNKRHVSSCLQCVRYGDCDIEEVDGDDNQ